MSYPCGHGGDWDTWIWWFGRFWQCRVCLRYFGVVMWLPVVYHLLLHPPYNNQQKCHHLTEYMGLFCSRRPPPLLLNLIRALQQVMAASWNAGKVISINRCFHCLYKAPPLHRKADEPAATNICTPPPAKNQFPPFCWLTTGFRFHNVI